MLESLRTLQQYCYGTHLARFCAALCPLVLAASIKTIGYGHQTAPQGTEHGFESRPLRHIPCGFQADLDRFVPPFVPPFSVIHLFEFFSVSISAGIDPPGVLVLHGDHVVPGLL